MEQIEKNITELPQDDIPGGTVKIVGTMMENACNLYEGIKKLLPADLGVDGKKTVISICGGSGVGKSSIAAILSYLFKKDGIGCYAISGDHYPHRIPKYNDAERLRIFRESGIHAMIKDGVYSKDAFEMIQRWQTLQEDADKRHMGELPAFASYLDGGRKGLEEYLGTDRELAFDEINSIISDFKGGADKLWLRRMGREETQLWYEETDVSGVLVLLLEWTHGNSDEIKGVDIPVLLNSTPQETLEYRKARNRDQNTDSPFTLMVLEIEQELLKQQAVKAKLILSKEGQLLTRGGNII